LLRTTSLVHRQADITVSQGRRKQTLRKDWPSQALSDYERIVAQRFKKFSQHLGLFGVLCHAVHFSLQLLSSNGLLPVLLKRP